MGTLRKTDGGLEAEGSSVLFSLGELMKLEAQRVGEEVQRARDAELAEERARLAHEASEAEHRAALALAERQRAEEQLRASREEAARLEALRAAAVEKARVEAEERARLAAMTAAQEHEKSLVALREDASKRRLSRWLGGVLAAGVLLVGGGLGIYFGKIAPDAEARDRAAAVDLERAREQLDHARRDLADRETAVAALRKERDAATDARKQAELDARIASEQKKIEVLSRGTGRLPPNVVAPPPPRKCGNPDDPLNDCL